MRAKVFPADTIEHYEQPHSYVEKTRTTFETLGYNYLDLERFPRVSWPAL